LDNIAVLIENYGAKRNDSIEPNLIQLRSFECIFHPRERIGICVCGAIVAQDKSDVYGNSGGGSLLIFVILLYLHLAQFISGN